MDKSYAIKKLKENYKGEQLKKLERYIEISEVLHDKNSCDLCTLYKLRKEILASDDIELLKAAIITFSELWSNAEFDRDYYKCIVDGSWPSAEEILTNSLEKIKERKGSSK